MSLTTFKDLIDHLTDWVGANPGAEVQRDARRSILGGLRDLSTAHRWSYFYSRGKLHLSAPYATGTIAYDHTGGASERLVTLSDGTWPSWAALGILVLDNIGYEVSSRLSDTEITLTSASNPGEDVAADTSYSLYRDTYPLPTDLVSIGQIILASQARCLSFEHPNSWLERQRIFHGQSQPYAYTVRGSPDYLGNMAISFYPPPDQDYQAEYIYQRLPRDLKLDEYKTGSASTTSGSTTVTGAGTNWTSRLVGTVFRVSRTSSDYPTGLVGPNPAAFERLVTAVNSTTSLTLDSAASETLGPVKYLLSDPIDVEPGAMLTALLRSIEYQMAHARRMRDRELSEAQYNRALILAREADSRNFTDERLGQGWWYGERLANMPRGPDVS